eukprot:TRINITY_DN391_c0_g1_i1.p1 TRINITY_DN391_c0_g1~~TRINITY_DN391_c0_g1_i1.p1  ORF type:complete len:224 (-),score=16.20 TRINITY_DN391_c0_g1_i1:120-791(-)
MLDHVINLLSILSPLLITSYVLKALPFTEIFVWHPTLISLGYLFLMVQGTLLLLRPSHLMSFFVGSSTRKQKISQHWYLQAFALLVLFSGFFSIWYSKVSKGRPHFTSWHSWFGVLALSLSVCQLFLGGYLYFPWIKKFLGITGGRLDLSLKKLHRISGMATFCTAVFSMVLGMWSTFAVNNIPDLVSWLFIGLILVLMLIVNVVGLRIKFSMNSTKANEEVV